MTIAQRIELRRLGYTKEEIAEFAELEKVPEPELQTETEPVPQNQLSMFTDPVTDTNKELLTAITNLTLALQNQKLNNTPQPEVKKETSEDILNNILKG